MALTPSILLLRGCVVTRWHRSQTQNQRDQIEADEITSIPAEMDWKSTQDTKEQTEAKDDATVARKTERDVIRGQSDILLAPAERYALFLHGSWPTTDSADEYIGVEFKQGMHTALLALHELDAIYRHPYLYEYIFHETLECKTPLTLVNLISDSIPRNTFPRTGPISVLNIEAGSGMVGRQLRNRVKWAVDRMEITGTDTSMNALAAVKRHQWDEPGRPQIYNDYFVLDLTDTTSAIVKGLKANPFHLVIISRALGPGPRDVSLEVFNAAVECLRLGSHIVITIEERNVSNQRLVDKAGGLAKPWGKLVKKLERAAMGLDLAWNDEWRGLRVVVQWMYVHRLSVKGLGIWYTAVIFEKV